MDLKLNKFFRHAHVYILNICSNSFSVYFHFPWIAQFTGCMKKHTVYGHLKRSCAPFPLLFVIRSDVTSTSSSTMFSAVVLWAQVAWLHLVVRWIMLVIFGSWPHLVVESFTVGDSAGRKVIIAIWDVFFFSRLFFLYLFVFPFGVVLFVGKC